jgi:preprotein translocase subunit SecG
MTTVLLVIHVMVAVALVGTVLLQRSEGGALGIGGGGGGGGFLTGRGAANLLTRTTAVLAAAFFATSIALTLIASNSRTGGSIIDSANPNAAPITSGNGAAPELPQLHNLPKSPPAPSGPQAPISQ